MAFFRDVREDIQTVLKKDPAARNSLEVLVCYPGIWALIWHCLLYTSNQYQGYDHGEAGIHRTR